MLLSIGSDKKVTEIPIVQIRPCRTQARKAFSHEKMRELAQSISSNGIIQPLAVRKISTIEYEIISGERRLRAAVICGRKKVPCIVMECDDRQAGILSLVENLQRCDLNFFEEAEGINKLMTDYGMSRQEISQKLGKKLTAVSNKLRILKLTEEEKEIIIKYDLTERHARALLRISDQIMRRIALSEIIEEGMNVTQSEKYIEEMLAEKSRQHRKKQKNRLVIKNIKIFENTINRAVDTMRSSGIQAVAGQKETEDFIEYTVRIQKNKSKTDEQKTMTA